VRDLRGLALAAALVLGLAACTGDPPSATTAPPTSPAGAVLREAKIAFVEDLSPDGAAQRVAPAFQGARLGIDSAILRGAVPASIRLVPMDTGGTPEGIRSVVEAIVSDPTIVAAIVAPQLTGQIALGDPLDAAGVPVVSLSTLGPDLPAQGWRYWRRAVPDVEREGEALAAALVEFAGPRRACLLGDGSPMSNALTHAVARALPVRPTLRLALPETDPDDPTVVAAIGGAGCRAVVWSGNPAGGALLRLALVAAHHASVRLFGGESLKDASYLTTSGPRGRGTIAVCPCVDLSTSTDFRAQRFIQDYQSAFGVPPGPFAAEAWDVVRLILGAVSSGAGTRSEVAQELAGTTTVDGLARSYAWGRDGALQDQAGAVRVYRDEGVRWVAQPSRGRA
jgi:ABC-type branched-subunit amino acid transport system substrate-binding protein